METTMLHVQVLESDPVTRNVITRELRRRGYAVDEFDKVNDLLKCLNASTDCDVVITDLPFKEKDTLLRVEQAASDKRTRVLVMTALDRPKLEKSGFGPVLSRASAVIEKGDSLTDFINDILSALSMISPQP